MPFSSRKQENNGKQVFILYKVEKNVIGSESMAPFQINIASFSHFTVTKNNHTHKLQKALRKSSRIFPIQF